MMMVPAFLLKPEEKCLKLYRNVLTASASPVVLELASQSSTREPSKSDRVVKQTTNRERNNEGSENFLGEEDCPQVNATAIKREEPFT